jgi:hypothetical protein
MFALPSEQGSYVTEVLRPWAQPCQGRAYSTYSLNVYDGGRAIIYVRFEVFTAVAMKNVVFWDIKTQFVPHRGYIASPLQCSAS